MPKTAVRLYLIWLVFALRAAAAWLDAWCWNTQFSLKLMGWKLNDTCYMGCPSLCTKRRHIEREFWVTLSNFPLKMQSLFKSAEGWCKFVNKSSSGCINWGYFSFSPALSDLGTCFSMPGSIHIYYTAKYFLWLCNENDLLYNPPPLLFLPLFHYRPLLSWDRIFQSLFPSHSRKHTHFISESHKLDTPPPCLSFSKFCHLQA